MKDIEKYNFGGYYIIKPIQRKVISKVTELTIEEIKRIREQKQ